MRRLRWTTPEGFAFDLPLAGLGARCLAWVIDGLVVGAVLALAGQVLSVLALGLPGIASALQIVLGFAVTLLYAAALEWFWQGQTIGKNILGLQVMEAHGLPLTGAQVLMRNLLRIVDILPGLYLAGGIACLGTRHSQRLGDQVAGTVVVQRRRGAQPDLAPWLAQKYNSLREHPQLALRLRHLTTPAEAGVALEALLRRDELEPARRAAIYRALVAHFQARVPFPEATLEALSPEQYLRNVVGILFPQRFPG
ncbi:MAG TPA: RDD family protein [Terriglobales bacterium]|nr:RDD family protein [Terriglobales bacterium]